MLIAFLLQATTDIPSIDFNLRDVDGAKQDCAADAQRRASEIVVCGRRHTKEGNRVPVLPPHKEELLLPKAEFALPGGARGVIYGEQVDFGSRRSRRAMVTVTVPFR